MFLTIIKLITFNLLTSIALLEGLFALRLTLPSLLKGVEFRSAIRNYYLLFDRKIIQYEPDCARYDPEVTYTLKPGNCEFSNREFRNYFSINSLGLRDDEASLAQPEIVIVGDSIAMGWGVNQDQTFAAIIEQKTGLAVLNAAVSSYGTVREMQILNRINTRNLKYLFIQYEPNDYNENQIFHACGNKFVPMNKEEYEKTIRMYQKLRSYYFGKYTFNLINIIFNVEFLPWDYERYKPTCPGGTLPTFSGESEAALFLNVLANAHSVNLNHVKIIVIILRGEKSFGILLGQRKSNATYPDFIQRLQVVDLNDSIGVDGYYSLDDHLNQHGHKVVADAILKFIEPVKTKQ